MAEMLIPIRGGITKTVKYPDNTSEDVLERVKAKVLAKYGAPDNAPAYGAVNMSEEPIGESPSYEPNVDTSQMSELVTGVPQEVDITNRAKIAMGLLFGADQDQQVGVIKSALDDAGVEHKFKMYDDGSLGVDIGGRNMLINKSGMSVQDFANTLGNITPYMLPGGKLTQFGKSIMSKLAIAGATDAAVGAGVDASMAGLGSGQGISTSRALLNMATPFGLKALGSAASGLLGKAKGIVGGAMPEFFESAADISMKKQKAASGVAIDLSLPQVTDNAAALATQRELEKLAPSSKIMSTFHNIQNKQVESALGSIIDSIAPKGVTKEAGQRVRRALQKNIENIKGLRKQFADEDYAVAFTKDPQVDMAPVRDVFERMKTIAGDDSRLASEFSQLEKELFDPNASVIEVTKKKGRKYIENLDNGSIEQINKSSISPSAATTESGTVVRDKILGPDGKPIATEITSNSEIVKEKLRKSLGSLRTDLRGLHAARQNISKKIGAYKRAKDIGSDPTAGNMLEHLYELKNTLDHQMFSASPEYMRATENYKAISSLLDMTEGGAAGGLTGKVLAIKELDLADVSKKIFTEGMKDPKLLLRTKKIVENVDKDAWNAVVRLDIERQLDALKDVGTEAVAPNIPSKVQSTFFDSPLKRKYYEMVLPPHTQKVWRMLGETVQHASRGRMGGSGTSAATESLSRVSDKLGGRNFGAIFGPLQYLKTLGFNHAYDNRLKAMATAFTDPNHAKSIEKFMTQMQQAGPNQIMPVASEMSRYIDNIVADQIMGDAGFSEIEQ